MLNKKLSHLDRLPYSAQEQRREAIARAGKLSIQGIQPKLSARLSIRMSSFEIVDRYGHYILKPQHADYPQLPENEGLTMHLAMLAGFDVPLNGMVYSSDGSLTYFIRRFDRVGKTGKVATEDFAQLGGRDRSTKYGSSMEKLVEILSRHCTFPAVETVKLFRRSLFSFLVGNEDMHLKNMSLIRLDGKIELSPMYDYLNSAIAMRGVGRPREEIEELALPLRGKKRNLTRRDWIDYYARERLQLSDKVIESCLRDFGRAIPQWLELIDISFLSEEMKELYVDLLQKRCLVLDI